MTAEPIQMALIVLGIGMLGIVAALAVMQLRQTRLLRETQQLIADIWQQQRTYQEALSRPILTISMSFAVSSGGHAPYLHIETENCGNGPANIQSVEVHIDGRAITLTQRNDHDRAALRLIEKQFTHSVGGFVSAGEHWLGVGKSTRLFAIELEPTVKSTTIDRMMRRLNLRLEYGSIFEQAPSRTAWLRPPAMESSPLHETVRNIRTA